MNPRNQRVIDTLALKNNMLSIRASVPENTKILAVVKADGYGHGAETVSRIALENGADMLAVACADEGVCLRKAGITAPILVLGAVTADDAQHGAENGLIQTVCSPEMVQLCAAAAKETGKTAEVHLKIDSGMGRIGVRTGEERDAVLREIQRNPEVLLTGAFTHFSDADGDEDGMEYTDEQYRKFLKLTEGMNVLRHCSNSAAIHRRPDMALDMVRAGISLYGYPPVETETKLIPCMRWTAKISYIKELPAGEYVSYGRTWKSAETRRIATVTCGYGDGYLRAAGERAEVLIRGKRAKIIGRICMDQMMADVTGIPDAAPEDEVILMGTEDGEKIDAEDIARWSGTISYEILLSVGSRVGRIIR